ncbi:MAG TPA: bifunctional DNA-formamidopyrimidine glycosylase/DNA-(apurinic or apyrimidinic site) lyase [Pyrinomonadaceae bacterium]|nr:bifunctional DNA-formamidopyrimidine glycosylase/DNA-(apurinic or apyrimidinic site) lyase [Pyrinomonadaceae bacterium]
MPELPEVEHVVRALRRTVSGRRIVAAEINLPKLVLPLSTAAFKRKIRGCSIEHISRRGKFILFELTKVSALPHGRATAPESAIGSALPHGRASAPKREASCDPGLILAVHLRMTGKFLVLTADDPLPRHAHAIFYLDDERRLVFNDQRQFGVMKLFPSSHLAATKGISELAPEPFSEDFSTAYLKEILSRSRRTLKTLLLDQTKVLGLGNIYAAEALFRAGINPFKIASKLSSRRIARLHQAIRDVLRAAVSGNSSKRLNLENPNGFSYGEAFGRVWQVYEREGEPCFKCGARIRRMTHGGRSTYWCPLCQKR